MGITSEQYNTILPQALDLFVSEQVRLHKEDPERFTEDPSIFFQIEPDELVVFIMNDDYWVGYWANFLLAQLIAEIYKEGDFQFSLN
jgi:hypothetical protein